MNGAITREPGTVADPLVDEVTLDGSPVPTPAAKHYVLLHKPRGYVTSRRDPQGRAVVTDLVPGPTRLFPVGRLDFDVEGALLLTNDGALAHRLLHPRYRLPRVYEADVVGRVTRADLPRWRRGVRLDDGPAVPLAVELIRAGAGTSRLHVTFGEGRKHEVKRYGEALGHRVARLRRIAFGPIALGHLPVGRSRPLTAQEVRALQTAVATAPASVR